jgi:pimeloyl-ACP methyl ester carboxylesterase
MSDAASILRDAERRLFAAHELEVRERFLELTAPRMRARVLESGAGPATLHVHGGGALGALMAPLAAALPGRRHLMVDRPGFGLSDLAPIAPSLRRHAVDFLRSTLDALELDRVDIVANSMGALWSLWLALDAPGRVRSLGLVGAPAMVGGGSAPMPMRLLGKPGLGALMMKIEAPSPKQVQVLWRRMGHDPAALHPTVLEVMLAAERMPAYGPAWRGLLGAALTLKGPAPGVAFADDDLRRLPCPVAYVWGAHDPFGDATFGRTVADRTPGAGFHIAGAGHLPWLDDAPAVARGLTPALAAKVEPPAPPTAPAHGDAPAMAS